MSFLPMTALPYTAFKLEHTTLVAPASSLPGGGCRVERIAEDDMGLGVAVGTCYGLARFRLVKLHRSSGGGLLWMEFTRVEGDGCRHPAKRLEVTND